MARRYARALYELGREEGLEKQFQDDMDNVVALAEESDEFKAIMVSPLYDITLKKRILSGMVPKLAISPFALNFFYILLDKDRFSFLPEIRKAYQDFLDAASGKVKAQVLSAIDLDAAQQQKIAAVFSQVMRKSVDVEIAVDPSLIGGLVVEVEGMVYDGSIKTQLSKIKQSLKGEM
ncbi:MAG: ATP synthase F1 subunit delta [Syntrophaceae bacterium]